MDIERSLKLLLCKNSHPSTAVLGETAPDVPDELVCYLKETFTNWSEDDLDLDDLADICEAYVPCVHDIPRSEFFEWFASTKEQYLLPKAEPVTEGAASNQLPNDVERKDRIGSEGTVGPGQSKEQKDKTSYLSDPVRQLASMFPQKCHLELEENLKLSHGDLDQAALITLKGPEKPKKTKKSRGRKPVLSGSHSNGGTDMPSRDPDNVEERSLQSMSSNSSSEAMTSEERLQFFERYGLVNSERRAGTYSVAPVIEEKKSTIRYLDGKVVDTKGKKYIEIKQEYPDMPKPTFLKPLRQYRFH
ncbi:unnamed protein product [Calicophoron daubneyi]|uniref:CUE domain-containing protein 2 n=1 Tax=Calicophoron daubneyi TaxID=300641 RepID=A0AAV2TLR9_CALDB